MGLSAIPEHRSMFRGKAVVTGSYERAAVLSAEMMMSLVEFLTITDGLVRIVLALRLRVVKEHV